MSDRRGETVSFAEVEVVHSTDKALLCRCQERQFWVPKSQISSHSEVRQVGDYGTLVVSAWWAEISGTSALLEEVERAQRIETNVELLTASAIYRRLAFKYHPDRSPDTAEFMKDLNELWQAVNRDLKKQ